MNHDDLIEFARESWRIEQLAIPGHDIGRVVANHEALLHGDLTFKDVTAFAVAIDGHAVLRDKIGMDVRVSNHVPPPGGDKIAAKLRELLD